MKVLDIAPTSDTFLHDVLAGLKLPQKRIPPKHLYDEAGSRLFERICGLKDYYVTRTEMGILRDSASEIASLVGEGCTLIEYGSGSSAKTRILLDRLRKPERYCPVDISRDYLIQASGELEKEYPSLDIVAVCADFSLPLSLPDEIVGRGPLNLAFLPGSTLGNFEPIETLRFLRNTARFVGRGGSLLIGIDLVKNHEVLERAYNDLEGVTAAFNLNLLSRINRELGGDLDPSKFRHRAFFNAEESRIEMHLVSLEDQEASIGPEGLKWRYFFGRGETIHTENSYKYRPASSAWPRRPASSSRRAGRIRDASSPSTCSSRSVPSIRRKPPRKPRRRRDRAKPGRLQPWRSDSSRKAEARRSRPGSASGT
jgi:dimethylhistidine N-methyltransferase